MLYESMWITKLNYITYAAVDNLHLFCYSVRRVFIKKGEVRFWPGMIFFHFCYQHSMQFFCLYVVILRKALVFTASALAILSYYFFTEKFDSFYVSTAICVSYIHSVIYTACMIPRIYYPRANVCPSLVGLGKERYRGGHGVESCRSLWVFHKLERNCLHVIGFHPIHIFPLR